MSHLIIEQPVISIQCDWNETLRSPKGEVWVSCKYRGQNSVHGKIISQGLSNGIPSLTASDNFEAFISGNMIRIKYLPSNNYCYFIASEKYFNNLHKKSVISIDETPNGLCVSTCTENKLIVWDEKTGEIRRTLEGHVGNVYKCRFFPSGIVVLSGGADMQLKIWSAETGQCPVTLSGHKAAITDFCIVERGRNVISVSKDGFAKLWDCGMSSCLADLIHHGCAINCCNLTEASSKIDIGEPDIPPSDREVGTRGKILIVGCEDGTILVISVWSRKKILTQVLESAVNCVTSLSNDEFVVGCQNGQILLFKIEKGNNQPVMCWFESNSAVLSILHYKEKGFFVGKADGSCTYYDASVPNHRVQLTGPDCDPVYDISCDGFYIYTACRDAVIRKYDVEKVISFVRSGGDN